MKELHNILELWSEVEARGEPAVLATVVKTQGSSYRLPGARMLLTRSGERAGSISGGCLEDELIRKAWWFTESGSLVRRYDTTPDGEIATEYGLGCNGIIHVLLERIYPGTRSVLSLIREVWRSRQPAAFGCLTLPPEQAGSCVSVDSSGAVVAGHSYKSANKELIEATRAALAEQVSHHLQLSSGQEAFIETLVPPTRLLVFGAGDDARPVTDLAKFLGWEVSVSDGRSHYARPDKFPNADQVRVRTPDDPGDAIDDWTVAVLMTHSYSQDLEILRELATAPLRYLGILGPRNRTERILADAGLDHSPVAPELHTPMGLDIGADGPEQVALSVVAEIQATLNGRSGGLLRQRRGSIHAREDNPDISPAAWAQSIACA